MEVVEYNMWVASFGFISLVWFIVGNLIFNGKALNTFLKSKFKKKS